MFLGYSTRCTRWMQFVLLELRLSFLFSFTLRNGVL